MIVNRTDQPVTGKKILSGTDAPVFDNQLGIVCIEGNNSDSQAILLGGDFGFKLIT